MNPTTGDNNRISIMELFVWRIQKSGSRSQKSEQLMCMTQVVYLPIQVDCIRIFILNICS